MSRADLSALRAELAQLLAARERAIDCGTTARGMSADPELSMHGRQDFACRHAVSGAQADSYSERIAAVEAQIKVCEEKLAQGAMFDRIMDGQYAAMDETMQAVAP